MRPIHLALVWHLHQPYYKDNLTSTYLLPWVRLRCAKDYVKMVQLADAYPGVKQTFNLVPALMAQIEDYAQPDPGYQDLFLNLSRRPAEDLTGEEREFVLRWMREAPSALRVQASPRYMELASRGPEEPFTSDDIRDLQVWFNLAWCDPVWADTDPVLATLRAKDRGFTETEKNELLDIQLSAAARVLPGYRGLADRRQAELTFSPYHHPILPLVAHVDSARSASPQVELPRRHFSHREDAERQIELGHAAAERLLGRRPAGMWPPEMAVGESVIGMATRAGIEWFISDEEVLARSLDVDLARDSQGRVQRPELLYQPYRIEREGRTVTVVFRDALLSNLIGFDYCRMPAGAAASDLVERLHRIHDQQGEEDFLVVIALDGENAWDFYPREGHDFLNALYSALEADETIVTTTVGEFLRGHGPRPLNRLHTGSWIGANLETWIGDPEQNTAWDLLALTRSWLEKHGRHDPAEAEPVAVAWREILIAEASDWFWWFSRRHDSGMDSIWDNQFRLHLRNVYKALDAKPPAQLFQPILERAPTPERRAPQALITPSGPDDPVWSEAGYFEAGTGFGALHRPVEVVDRVLYGSDAEHLYLRVDSRQPADELIRRGISFWFYFSGVPAASTDSAGASLQPPLRQSGLADLGFDPAYVARITPQPQGAELVVARLARGRAAPVWESGLESPFFASIPFPHLDKRGGEPMELALVVERGGRDLEQVPPVGSLGLRVPRPESRVEAVASGSLKVLMAASEIAPFARTGGVADVTAALAKELHRLGHDIRLVMPRYRQVDLATYGLNRVLTGLRVPLGGDPVECTVFEGRLGDVPAYFVDCPPLYDRDGLYGFGDDDARFIYLSRALVEMLPPLKFAPDVVHVHDWQVALVPNLIDRLYGREASVADMATVLTIHNLAFQGVFGPGSLHLAGLDPWGLIRLGVPKLDEVVNILGRGIQFADVVNTVSERYASEIQTPEFGEGLDEVLRNQAHKLYGIVNGIDVELFDPERDPALEHPYSAADISGKELTKVALRQEVGLAEPSQPGRTPLVALVSRLYDQKGIDLVERAMEGIMDLDLQLAVLGTGDRRYEDMFRYQAALHADRLAARIGFDPGLAQRIYAGADMLLMPSRIEPCGLGQLIALRYGTVPVVRFTGGLADTISDFDPETGSGVGFVFREANPWQLHAAVVRAVETYRYRDLWTGLVRRGMAEDVSWSRSARKYVQLYVAAIAAHAEGHGRASLTEPAGA
jgi:starch synthase